MNLAEIECPPPECKTEGKRGRKKKGKARALIERLIKFKEAVCLFIRNFKVPFDNNQAERDVRNVKTKSKVSGCFQSLKVAQNYLTIMSYLSTARKAWDQCIHCFNCCLQRSCRDNIRLGVLNSYKKASCD